MNERPPLIARWLLHLTTNRETRAPLFGDLDEEFARRNQLPGQNANQWYLQQAISSAPHLLCQRIVESAANPNNVLLCIGAGAYAAIMVWNELIGEPAGVMLAAQAPAIFASAEIIERIAEQFCVAIVGAAVAFFRFDNAASFKQNVQFRLATVYFALLFFAFVKRLFVSVDSSILMQSMGLILASLSLVLGARLGFVLRRNRRRSGRLNH